MNNVTELKTRKVTEREEVDEIVAHMNELHKAGKLHAVAAFYETKDGGVFTWITCGMKLDSLAYGIELLRKSLWKYIGGPDG